MRQKRYSVKDQDILNKLVNKAVDWFKKELNVSWMKRITYDRAICEQKGMYGPRNTLFRNRFQKVTSLSYGNRLMYQRTKAKNELWQELKENIYSRKHFSDRSSEFLEPYSQAIVYSYRHILWIIILSVFRILVSPIMCFCYRRHSRTCISAKGHGSVSSIVSVDADSIYIGCGSIINKYPDLPRQDPSLIEPTD